MKLFKISQNVNSDYDTYSEAIVCANDKEEAKWIHPNGYDKKWDGKKEDYGTWCNVEDVKVKSVGKANSNIRKGVVCASFHAG